MTTHDTNRHGRMAVMALITATLAAIAILWSWNTIAVDLFGQTKMAFRHALAVEAMAFAIGALAWLPALFRRRSGG